MLTRLLTAALLLGPIVTHAQDYPNRPVRMVMPFAPGGPTDVVARIVAQSLGERLGQAVVIENRPGANGIIGTEAVARAEPDGHTLLLAPTSHTINPSMYKKLPYDTVKDFASVAYIGNSSAMVLVVGNAVPAKSVSELVAIAKREDGKLAYGSAGAGNLLHLAAEHFSMMTGAKLLHVPYKGAGPVVTALYTGEIQVAFLGPVQAASLVKDGKLRALAVTGPKRLPQLADVPTMIEAGYSGYDFDGGIQAAIYAPAKTPRDIVMKLNREINAVLDEPATRQRFEQLALDVGGGGPEVLDRQVAMRIKKYAEIIKAANIQPE
jgi:tripartite-type tricarboxylate transporter receptor subunit TctC